MKKRKAYLYALSSLIVLLLMVAAWPLAAAEPMFGSSPSVARPLKSGLNVGTLQPGESLWYIMDGEELHAQSDRMAVLNLIYKPADHDVSPYVNFQVLSFDQVDRWLQGFTDKYIGMGVFTTTDFDQDTSERLWSGNLSQDTVYYVRLFNNSSQPVEFHLMALSQESSPTVGKARARVVEATAEGLSSYQTVERPVQVSQTSFSIEPAAASSTSVGLTMDALSAPASLEEAQWQLVAAAVQRMAPSDAAAWLMMASQLGWLPGGNALYSPPPAADAGQAPVLPVQPTYAQTELQTVQGKVGASLATGAENAAAESAPSLFDLYPNVYPTRPLALNDGVNIGKLAPGGEHWFSFIREDMDDQLFERMAITLFSTPTNGNTSHHINFQMYTGSQFHIWERGTPDDMVPMGQGQWVSRDGDPVTGERVWGGYVVDGDTYFVRVFNNSSEVIDYYLITRDVYNTELGDRVWAATPPAGHMLWQPGTNVPRPH